MEYISLGRCCSDCAIAISNDDYTGMSDEQEKATKEGLDRIGQFLIVGEQFTEEYGPDRCVVCDEPAGDVRYEVGYMDPAAAAV